LSGNDRSFTIDTSTDRALVQSVDQSGNVSVTAEWRR
jgi:hypothetical protein